MNGLSHILSISTTFIPTSFTLHLLYPVFLLKKAKLYGLPEPFCLCFAFIQGQATMGHHKAEDICPWIFACQARIGRSSIPQLRVISL